jgi:hypothetical protein
MMKWLLIISFVFIGCAGYHPQPLTKAQIAGEVAFEVLHAIDWGQTLDIAGSDEYYEMNPIIGRYPSRGRVNLVMCATAIGHPIVTWLIPDSWRWWWIGGTSVGKAVTVIHNNRIGLKMDF